MRSTSAIPVVLAAAFFAGGLVWCTFALTGKWFILALAVLFLPWVIFLFRDLEAVGLFLFGLFLPMNPSIYLNYEQGAGGAKGLGVTLCDVLLFALYLLWLSRVLADPSEKRRVAWVPSVTLPLGLFLVWGGFSVLWAVEPAFTLYEVLSTLRVWLIFFYIANNVRRESRLRVLMFALCLAVILQGLLASAQYFSGATFGLEVLGETRKSLLYHRMGDVELARVGGTLGHPNTLAGFLLTLLPVLSALRFSSKRRGIQGLIFGVFASGLLGLLLTFSRGGWSAFLLTFPPALFLLTWKRRGFWRACGLLLLFVLMACLLLWVFQEPLQQRLFEHDYGRAQSRVPLMEVAWNMIRSHPFLGVGLNNYTFVMRNYDNTLERISLYIGNPVHNIYLLVLAETGLVGLFCLLWMHGSLLRLGWRGFRRGEGIWGYLSLGALMGMLGYIFFYLLNPAYVSSNAYFAVLMGLLAVSAIRDERLDTDR